MHACKSVTTQVHMQNTCTHLNTVSVDMNAGWDLLYACDKDMRAVTTEVNEGDSTNAAIDSADQTSDTEFNRHRQALMVHSCALDLTCASQLNLRGHQVCSTAFASDCPVSPSLLSVLAIACIYRY